MEVDEEVKVGDVDMDDMSTVGSEGETKELDVIDRLLEQVPPEEPPFDEAYPSFSNDIDEIEADIEMIKSEIAINNKKGNWFKHLAELRTISEEEKKRLDQELETVRGYLAQRIELLRDLIEEKVEEFRITLARDEIEEYNLKIAFAEKQQDELKTAMNTPPEEINAHIETFKTKASKLQHALALNELTLATEKRDYKTSVDEFLLEHKFVFVMRKKCYVKKYPLNVEHIKDYKESVRELDIIQHLISEQRATLQIQLSWLSDINEQTANARYDELRRQAPMVRRWARWGTAVIAFLVKSKKKIDDRRLTLRKSARSMEAHAKKDFMVTERGWYLHPYTNRTGQADYTLVQKPFIHTTTDRMEKMELKAKMKERVENDEALTTFDDVIDLTNRPDLCFIHVMVERTIAPELLMGFKCVLAETKKTIEASTEEFLSYLQARWSAVTNNIVPFPFQSATPSALERRETITRIPNKAIRVSDDKDTAVPFACQGLPGHVFTLNNEIIISGIELITADDCIKHRFLSIDDLWRRVQHAITPKWEQECKILSINNGLRLERCIDILDVDTYVKWSRGATDKTTLFQFFGAVAITRCVGCDQLLWFWHNPSEVLYDQYFCSGGKECLLFPKKTQGKSAVALFPPDLIDFYLLQLFNGRQLGLELLSAPGGITASERHATSAAVLSTLAQLDEATISINEAIDFVTIIERTGLAISPKVDSYSEFSGPGEAYLLRARIALKHCTREDAIHWELYQASVASNALSKESPSTPAANGRLLERLEQIASEKLKIAVTSRFNGVLKSCITLFYSCVVALADRNIINKNDAKKLYKMMDDVRDWLNRISYNPGAKKQTDYKIKGIIEANDTFMFQGIKASIRDLKQETGEDAWTYLKTRLNALKNYIDETAARVKSSASEVEQKVTASFFEKQLALVGTYRPLNCNITERTRFRNRLAYINRYNLLVRMLSYSVFWNLFTNAYEMDAEAFEKLCDKTETIEVDLTRYIGGKTLDEEDEDAPQHWDLTEVKSIMQGRSKFLQFLTKSAATSAYLSDVLPLAEAFATFVQTCSRYPERTKNAQTLEQVATLFGETLLWDRDVFAKFCLLISYKFIQSPPGDKNLVGVNAWNKIPATERDNLANVVFEEKKREKKSQDDTEDDPTAFDHVMDLFTSKTMSFIANVTDEKRPDPCLFSEVELECVVQYCASEQRVVDSFKELFANAAISDSTLLGIQNALRRKMHLFKQRNVDEISSFLDAIIQSRQIEHVGTEGKRKREPKDEATTESDEEPEMEEKKPMKIARQIVPDTIADVEMKQVLQLESKAVRAVLPSSPDAAASAEEATGVYDFCSMKEWIISNTTQGASDKTNSRGLEIELTQKLRRLFTSTATAVEEWLLDEKAMMLESASMLYSVTGISKQKQKEKERTNPSSLALPLDPNLIPWHVAPKTDIAMYMLDLMGVRRIRKRVIPVRTGDAVERKTYYSVTDSFAYVPPSVDPDNAIYKEYGYPLPYHAAPTVEPWDNKLYRDMKRKTKPREYTDIPTNDADLKQSCQRCNQPLGVDDIKACYRSPFHRGIHRECCNEEDFALFQTNAKNKVERGVGCSICVSKRDTQSAACCMCNQSVAHFIAEDPIEAEKKREKEERKKALEKKAEEEKKKADEKKTPEEKKAEEEKRQADEKKAAEEKKIADEKKTPEQRKAEEKKAEEDKKEPIRREYDRADDCETKNCALTIEHDKILRCCLCRLWYHPMLHFSKNYRFQSFTEECLRKHNIKLADTSQAWSCARCSGYEEFSAKYDPKSEDSIKCVDCYRNFRTDAFYDNLENCATQDEEKIKLEKDLGLIRASIGSNVVEMKATNTEFDALLAKPKKSKDDHERISLLVKRKDKQEERNMKLRNQEDEKLNELDKLNVLRVFTSTCALQHAEWDASDRPSKLKHITTTINKLKAWRCGRCLPPSAERRIWNMDVLFSCPTRYGRTYELVKGIGEEDDLKVGNSRRSADLARRALGVIYEEEDPKVVMVDNEERKKAKNHRFVDSLGMVESKKKLKKEQTDLAKEMCREYAKWRKGKEKKYDDLFAYHAELAACIDILLEHDAKADVTNFRGILKEMSKALQEREKNRKTKDEKTQVSLYNQIFGVDMSTINENEEKKEKATSYVIPLARKRMRTTETAVIRDKKAALRIKGVYFNALKSLFFDIPIEIVSELRADILHQSWRTRHTKGFPSVLTLLPPRKLPAEPLLNYRSWFTFYTPGDLNLVATLESKDETEEVTFIQFNMITAALERGDFALLHISNSIKDCDYVKFQMLSKYGVNYGFYKQWDCLIDGTFTQPVYTLEDKIANRPISLDVDVRATPMNEYRGMFNQQFINAVVQNMMLEPLASIINWPESRANKNNSNNPEGDFIVQKRNLEKLFQAMNCKSIVRHPEPNAKAAFFAS